MARLISSCGERPQNLSWIIEVPRAKNRRKKPMWESRHRGSFSMNFPATNPWIGEADLRDRPQTRALPCILHGHGSLYRSAKLNHRIVESEACAPPFMPQGGVTEDKLGTGRKRPQLRTRRCRPRWRRALVASGAAGTPDPKCEFLDSDSEREELVVPRRQKRPAPGQIWHHTRPCGSIAPKFRGPS